MQRLRFEFSADWTRQKCQIVSLEIRRLLSSFRGAENFDGISIVNPEPEKPQRPEFLKLICIANPGGRGRCNATWEAKTYTPCPTCGQKRYVHKITDPEVTGASAPASAGA